MKKIALTLLAALLSFSGYSQTKKPVTKPKTPSSTSGPAASIARGKAVYSTYCVACHLPDGGGVPNLNAPLIKTSYVLGPKKPLIEIILKGMQGIDIDGESYSNVMPPHNFLSNQQIADVLTYVRNNFGNKASAVTVAEVGTVRAKK